MSNPIVINPSEVVALSERLGASGNQARVNSGCMCDSGCDSCARLAEAFTEMHLVLKAAPKPPFDSGYRKAMMNYALDCARWHAGLENTLARAALALAARVKA